MIKYFSFILFFFIKFNFFKLKMFKIDDKFSGKDKRKTIGYLKEDERQLLRKKEHNVSRILDNYFFPKIHPKAWLPNGLFLRKKYYDYGDSGLGYFYEQGYIGQPKHINDEIATKKIQIQKFIEYKYLEENQFSITIEFCSNCHEHAMHTFHSSELYKNFALRLQKCIQIRFPFINVLLKPIDTELKNEEYKLPSLKKDEGKTDENEKEQNKEIKIGAMEIQICTKRKNNEEIALIHSKLKTGKWPKINEILDKIVSFLPMFKGQIILYEKEENNNNQNINEINEDEKNQIIKQSFLSNLQVNIYLLKNSKILQVSEEAWIEIQNDINPKKRLELIKEKRLKEKESMYRPQSNFSNINKSKLKRPFSSLSHKSNSSTNIFRRPNSVSNSSNQNNFIYQAASSFNRPGQEIITDKYLAKSMKGKLLLTKYTNNDGIIDIGPLPYDSYLIEVLESRQYMGIWMTLSFSNVYSSDFIIKKYIGLYTQENSFFELHVFENFKDNEGKDDMNHISNCNVTLKTCKDEENDDYVDDKEIKIKIDEKSNGIFEYMVLPGKYLLEVSKNNYETVRKFVNLEKGYNNINVEMFTEKICNLKISVYNYEKFQDEIYEPIQSAEITIYKNSNEVIYEGISDKNGEMLYIVTKGEDFLTIVVNKLSYFPVQRQFIRSNNQIINEKGEYEENFMFFLVKESYVRDNNCIIFITYTGINEVNFDPNSIQLSNKIKNYIDLSCYDGQKENGILSTNIKYKQEENENSNNENNNIIDNNNNEINNENNDDDELDNFDEILSISYNILTESLKIYNYQDKGFSMNGLERYGCLTMIYTPNNIFYIPAPNFCKDGYSIWNLGWLDVKNQLFYETNTLSSELIDRLSFFSQWIDFLQKILDEKLYSKLFQFFGFGKGLLINNDRFIYEDIFIKSLTDMKFNEEDNNDIFYFISQLMKGQNKLISFSLFKKKITSNLKNFKEDINYNESI